MKTDNSTLFAKTPIHKAVISLAVPTVISQIITVIYNIADTFFIGQIGDPRQVAAVTLSMPAFVLLTGFANIFGIGGSSLIARSFGAGNIKKARQCAAFSIWGAFLVSLLYGLLIMVFRPVLLPLLGANADTFDFSYRYMFWTITIGAVPTVMNATLAHLVRSEGYARSASIGVAFGGILNIVLDPLFIFVFKMEITGAAIATMLSNFIAVCYFVILIYRKRRTTMIIPNPKNFTLRYRIPSDILLVGLPSFMIYVMGICSNVVLNKLAAAESNEAIAGLGIAKKIDTLAFAIANGMAQGVLPLVAFNYAARNFKRMRSAIKTAFAYTTIVSTVGGIFLFTCAVPVSRFFINDTETVAYCQHFLKIISVTCPTISVSVMANTIFQATGKKVQPMIISVLRKGVVDIPFMLLLHSYYGAYGIAWATPISDVICMCVALCLFAPFWRKLKRQDPELNPALRCR